MNFRKSRSNLGIRNISELNWAGISKCHAITKEAQLELLQPFKIELVLPQLMALLASDQFRLSRTAEGKVSLSESLSCWKSKFDEGCMKFEDGMDFSANDFAGMLSFIRVSPRSVILPSDATQMSNDWIRFATCVPLYMSAFKQFRNLKYSEWDYTDPKLGVFVDEKMLGVLKSIGKVPVWDVETLLDFRDTARLYKSGAKEGQMRTLNGTYSITGVKDKTFTSLPDNVKLLLCQTWVYQPGCSTDFGIYNLEDPDLPAVPLVNEDVFTPTARDKKITKQEQVQDVGLWD